MSSARIPASIRRVVAARARNYCEYCRCSDRFATESFSVEHIQPQSAEGASVLENLAWSCMGCNGHKHAKTQATDPETGETVALFHPRQQIWDEHFGWNETFTRVIGKTPCGRASVEALHLNRAGVMNLRLVLANAGLHPPQ